jgi:hypothetical protein
MQPADKPLRKPLLSSQKKASLDSFDQKLAKIDIFFRYSPLHQDTT